MISRTKSFVVPVLTLFLAAALGLAQEVSDEHPLVKKYPGSESMEHCG